MLHLIWPMPNDQNQNDWQHGFLVKDTSGRFTKVTDDSSLDLDESAPQEKPQAPAASSTPQTRPPVPKPVSPASPPPAPPTPPAPQPPVSQQSPAPVQFDDEEDAAEIKQHQEALQRMVSQPKPDVSSRVESIVSGIINSQHLTFANDVLQKRFEKVLESRLRNLRNSIETADVLTRPEKIGGLHLSQEQADQVIQRLEAEIPDLQGQGRKQPSPTPPPAQPKPTKPSSGEALYSSAPPAFVPRPGGAASPSPAQPKPTLPATDAQAEVQAQLAELQKSTAPATPPPAPPKPQPTPPPTAPQPRPIPSDEPHELYGQPAEEMPRIRPLRSDKPHVVDIRQPSQVIGPVEEIRQIDLKEFRRMGTNPTESAEKVKEKIDLLEEESWEMRVQGIRAWKESPVFSLYVAIGRASLDTNSSVENIIIKRTEEQKAFLLAEEFYAINELNMSMQI